MSVSCSDADAGMRLRFFAADMVCQTPKVGIELSELWFFFSTYNWNCTKIPSVELT